MTIPLLVRLQNKHGLEASQQLDSSTTFEELIGKVKSFADPQADPNLLGVELKCELPGANGSPGYWMPVTGPEALQFAKDQNHSIVTIVTTVQHKGAVASFAEPPPVAQARKVSAKTKTKKGASSSKPKVAMKKTTAKTKLATTKARRGDKSVEQSILSSLAELAAAGISDAPRMQVAFFSGYSNLTSKGFRNAMSKLKGKGYIEYPDTKTVRMTQAGIGAVAGDISPPANNEEVQQRIKKLLKPKACLIFDTLAHGRALAKNELAVATGYTNLTSKGFRNAVSNLRSLGIVDYVKDPPNSIVLTDLAFPFGRPGASTATGGNGMKVEEITDDSSYATM